MNANVSAVEESPAQTDTRANKEVRPSIQVRKTPNKDHRTNINGSVCCLLEQKQLCSSLNFE